jgi:hypothetical protein
LSLKRPPALIAIPILTATTLAFLLSSCSSPNSTSGDPPADSPHANPPEITNPNTSVGATGPVPTDPKQIYATALEMWRRPIPKGSCAACHGADFFDLARIGTGDETLRRRALGDTATQTEAESLVLAVRQMRLDQKLPKTNPLEFRPLQPGGAPLPGSTTIERDINFGKQLKSITPTLMGSRVDSLAKAQTSCNELNGINLRTMPTGIVYPLWSSDLFNGKEFGTMNDWVADAPREPTNTDRTAWLALQTQYLEQPTNENFWKMYAKVDAYTAPLPGTGNGAKDFTLEKFKSALVGQHLMREGLNPNSTFARGTLAFSYLDQPEWKTIIGTNEEIPGGRALWEVGDKGRTVVGANNDADGVALANNARAKLSTLKNGFPQFAVESIPADMLGDVHEEQIRLAWFWIGFTFNPSLDRISGSNSTKVGEYMIGSLLEQKMNLHNTFFTQARLCAKGLLPEANYKTPTYFKTNYGYFIGYNREVLSWNVNKGDPIIPDAQKLEQQNLWHTFTANAFRSSLYLYAQALKDPATLVLEKTWTAGKDGVMGVNPANGLNDDRSTLPPIKNHLACYQPQHALADTQLVNDVESKLGLPVTAAATCNTKYPPLQPTNP